jgi:hypothetical protein
MPIAAAAAPSKPDRETWLELLSRRRPGSGSGLEGACPR